MSFYSRDCKKIDLKEQDMEYLTLGTCAKIYYNEERILKVYYPSTLLHMRLTIEIFDKVKNIKHPNFIELIEIYNEMEELDLEDYKNNLIKFETAAYLAKYYLEDHTNILLKSKDYLLDNLRELEELFDIFTDYSITYGDAHRGNVVLTEDKIVLIDPDSFRDTWPYARFKKGDNKAKLLILLRNIINDAIKNENRIENNIKLINDMEELYKKIAYNSNTDITYEFSKKLSSVKRPIEYFLK